MTKTEARKILKEHNSWRRGKFNVSRYNPEVVGEAIDEIVKYPEIAADIRDAAIYWPDSISDNWSHNVCDAEIKIIRGFLNRNETFGPAYEYTTSYLLGSIEALTFMLFVAEALAS